jgi:hypothetical protein
MYIEITTTATRTRKEGEEKLLQKRNVVYQMICLILIELFPKKKKRERINGYLTGKEKEK